MEVLNSVEIAQRFNDEDACREMLERIRWPEGAVCPKCGCAGTYKISLKPGSKTRKSLYKCKGSRKQFTVTVGTIFEASHIPLNKWLMAVYMMCSSKIGISAHQLHRSLGIIYKTAWFMCHRIRYAMDEGPLAKQLNGIIEADETYVGGKGRGKRGRGAEITWVERGGKVNSQVVADVTAKTLQGLICLNAQNSAIIVTDEFCSYRGLDKKYKAHKVINHGKKEYVRREVHTNTLEGFFSHLKRGITGCFHHVSKEHLHRYLKEFDFRYNHRKDSDSERTLKIIKGFEGKRLMCRHSS